MDITKIKTWRKIRNDIEFVVYMSPLDSSMENEFILCAESITQPSQYSGGNLSCKLQEFVNGTFNKRIIFIFGIASFNEMVSQAKEFITFTSSA